MALDTGNTTSPGPETPINITNSLQNGINYGIELPALINIPSSDSIYTGSLSAHGSVVAMALNPGMINAIVEDVGVGDDEFQRYTSIPYMTGYLREYWRAPQSCTFGANSAIPAITGVMPSRFSETPGNLLYYIDLQMTRLTGSNYFNNYSFINSFNQFLGWLSVSNQYLLAINNAEKRNLSYFNVNSYNEFLTQGFNRYAEGQALRQSLKNIGNLIQQIPTGYFGTSNSVAKHLVDIGLGAIGQLSLKIQTASINFADILNPIYTQQLNEILSTINNAADLLTIQRVLKSSVPNISSALDYTSIEKCSGRSNDSVFANFIEFGKDLYQKTPNFNISTGEELANLIDTVLSEATQNIENLATPTSLLPDEIIQNFKKFLPKTPDGKPASLLNVIGCGTGYLIDYLDTVNRGLDQLNQTPYGPQIHAALTNILDAYTKYYQEFLEIQLNESGDWSRSNRSSFRQVIYNPISDNRWSLSENLFYQQITAYENLLNQIANDPVTKDLVQRINLNYELLCEGINTEVVNFNKANVTLSELEDNTIIYTFISGLPGYALDTQGLGTDYFLYSLCQPNPAGDSIKSTLNQFKNIEILANAGVQIRGVI
jgi:hypothetical protein